MKNRRLREPPSYHRGGRCAGTTASDTPLHNCDCAVHPPSPRPPVVDRLPPLISSCRCTLVIAAPPCPGQGPAANRRPPTSSPTGRVGGGAGFRAVVMEVRIVPQRRAPAIPPPPPPLPAPVQPPSALCTGPPTRRAARCGRAGTLQTHERGRAWTASRRRPASADGHRVTRRGVAAGKRRRLRRRSRSAVARHCLPVAPPPDVRHPPLQGGATAPATSPPRPGGGWRDAAPPRCGHVLRDGPGRGSRVDDGMGVGGEAGAGEPRQRGRRSTCRRVGQRPRWGGQPRLGWAAPPLQRVSPSSPSASRTAPPLPVASTVGGGGGADTQRRRRRQWRRRWRRWH